MHGNAIAISLVLSIGVVYSTAHGQASSSFIDSNWISLNKIKSRLSSSANVDDKVKIDRIQIEIRRIPNDRVALAQKTSTGGRVLLSGAFLLRVAMVAEAATIELITRPDYLKLIESYHEHIYDQTELVHGIVQPLVKYAGLNESEIQLLQSPKFQTMKEGIRLQIMAVVLAHEIGHIVNDGFYEKNAPNNEKIRIEKAADNWGYRSLERCGIPPLVGAYYSSRMLAVTESPEYWVKDYPTHPNVISRVVESFETDRSRASALYESLVAQNRALSQREQQNMFPVQSPEELVQDHFRLLEIFKALQKEDADRNVGRYVRLANDKRLGNKLRSKSAYAAAHMYLRGWKAEKSDKNALKYFILASRFDHPMACVWAATMYKNGWGNKRDISESNRLVSKAKNLGLRFPHTKTR